MGSMERRPNFLIILADDLGYSDIGCFGSEIRTPNIDKLAQDGARFSNYYTASACSPTRAMLMSGTDNHIAGVGVMSEQKGEDPERWNVKGHEGFLNHDVAAVSEILQDSGYYTVLSGKWHLGLKPENNPAARGFDRSFALLPGCSNHYGWEPQFADKDYNNFFVRIPPLYTEDGKKYEVPPNLESTPKGFFSSDFYTDNLIDYLKNRPAEHEDKPFFAYLPFSAPHWPLQCHKSDRDRYKGKYNNGPYALREKRLERMKALGLVAEDVKPHEVFLTPGDREWSTLNDYEKSCSSRAMECFAGMVDNIDQNVGKMIEYLKRTGQFEDTVIIFQSDNGAEGAALEARPVVGPDLMRVVSAYYDNSLDNIGNYNSFAWYGTEAHKSTKWAQASTAPSRLYKMQTTEGGIKVPMVLHYPGFADAKQNGVTLKAFTTVMDIVPTFLELAGVPHPAADKPSGTFRGRTVANMRGISWVNFMNSSTETTDIIEGIKGEAVMGWELFGRAAIRKGSWKIVKVDPRWGGREDGLWQLYNLATDPGETDDLADIEIEKLKELQVVWEQYRKDTGTVWGQSIRKLGKAWDSPGPDDIGGDTLEETRAWMRVKGKGVPKI